MMHGEYGVFSTDEPVDPPDDPATYVGGGFFDYSTMPETVRGGIMKVRQTCDPDADPPVGYELHTWRTSTALHPTRALFGWWARRWFRRHPLAYKVWIMTPGDTEWRIAEGPVVIR